VNWQAKRVKGSREGGTIATSLHIATLLILLSYHSPQFIDCFSFYRAPKISTLQEIYAEVGFTPGPAVILTNLFFKPEQYYNKEGPFTKEWRNTDRSVCMNMNNCLLVECISQGGLRALPQPVRLLYHGLYHGLYHSMYHGLYHSLHHKIHSLDREEDQCH
jgi:hypothetical protein